MCVSMIEWLVVCIVSSVGAWVRAVHQTRVCAHPFEKLFFVIWLECPSDKGDTHLRELPLFLCLKWKLLLSWCSGTRRTGEIRPLWETGDNQIPRKWQADRLGGTCFQYAALCKRYIREISCQQRDTHEAPFIQLKSVWPLKKNEFAFFNTVFIDICYGLFISFCVCFWNIYSCWFTYAIGFFFFSFDCLPCKPAPIARKSWMCGQNVSRK